MDVHLNELIPVPSEADAEAARQQQRQRQLRQAAMSDSRRALVLEAARSVFAEKGVEGASIREIAKRAAYTPGAIYSYFDSKEAIYAALLAESLERLNQEVSAARAHRQQPALTLASKAQAWFGFYARNPRDLDLGFYLVQGLAPRGLTSEFNHQLNDRLHDALRACEHALQAMGLSPEAALRENTAQAPRARALRRRTSAPGIRATLAKERAQVRIVAIACDVRKRTEKKTTHSFCVCVCEQLDVRAQSPPFFP